MSKTAKWTISDSEKLYGVKRWSSGYFEIGPNGNLHVTPDVTNAEMRIDFNDVIEEIKEEGIQFPVVLRFHDILRSQVALLNETFIKTIQDAAVNNQNIFEELMETCKHASLGQVTNALFEVGGQYRRNM